MKVSKVACVVLSILALVADVTHAQTPQPLYMLQNHFPGGSMADVVTFAQDGSQGTVPNAVTIAQNGLLYRTTQGGGSGNAGVAFLVYNGTIFVLLERHC